MDAGTKLRLYLSVIVLVLLVIYTGPIPVLTLDSAVQDNFYVSCMKNLGDQSRHSDYCYDRSKGNDGALPFYYYFLPYLPAAVLLWANWLFKPNLRLTAENFPKRTIKVLLWFGLFVATVGIVFQLLSVASTHVTFDKAHVILKQLFIFAAPLVAPMLFYFLVVDYNL